MKNTVADSGFFIALFDETDPLHGHCREFLKGYRGRLLTTEAVLTETMALLSIPQQLRCLQWLAGAERARLLRIDREPLDIDALQKLACKYADQPMDFADATVVQLATRSGIREVLTTDRRDFAVYRLNNRVKFIDVLAEPAPAAPATRR
ncbi:MAG: PIN domain-containing protein [Steroidobacteraceae bacterium]